MSFLQRMNKECFRVTASAKTVLGLFLIMFVFFTCSSSDDSGSSSSSSASSSDSGDVELITTINSEASVSSSTSSVSGSLAALIIARGSGEQSNIYEEDPDAHFLEKKAALDNILNPTTEDDCRYKPHFRPSPANVLCFGPSISYTDHPDGGSGSMPGGDLGIWNHSFMGEACAAAKLNSLVHDVSGLVGSAMGMAASLACHAHFDGRDADIGEGESHDLADLYHGKVGEHSSALTIEKAIIQHEGTHSDHPIISSIFEISIGGEHGGALDGGKIGVRVSHGEKDDGFFGKINISIIHADGFHQFGTSCTSAGQVEGERGPKKLAYSVLYKKSDSGTIQYRMRRAYFCKPGDHAFDEHGFLDFNGKWSADALEITMENDTTTGLGTVRSVWQAGPNDGATRVFLARLKDDYTGTAFFGFGNDLESSEGDTDFPGRMYGMHCNWLLGGGALGPFEPVVQRQKIVLDEDSGNWVIESSNIRYAPTNDCSYDGLGTFTYSTLSGLMSNDNTAGDAVSHNLVPLGNIGAEFKPPRIVSSDFSFSLE